MKNGLAALLILVLVAAPASAAARGGKDIASAPAIAYSQQQFGNTATDDPSAGQGSQCASGRSWWGLPVVAGDKVTLDWEGAAEYLDVWPVGTTDFNVNGSQLEQQGHLGSNGKQEVLIPAKQSGTMPLTFWTSTGGFCPGLGDIQPGPFDFTAYVKHAVLVSVPKMSSLARKGAVDVGVHNPDGAAIDDQGLVVALQLRVAGKLRRLGTAPAVNGVAHVAYRLARSLKGAKGSLSATAAGAAYQTKSSTVQKLRIR